MSAKALIARIARLEEIEATRSKGNTPPRICRIVAEHDKEGRKAAEAEGAFIIELVGLKPGGVEAPPVA